MTPPAVSAAEPLLLLLSLVWAWDVYVHVPILGVNLTVCIGTAMVVLWATALVSHMRLRLPFELAWPAALLIGLTWVRAWRGEPVKPLAATGSMLLFAATVQFARSRETITRCLWLSCVSGACVALITLFSRAGLIMPTAYSLKFGLNPKSGANVSQVLENDFLSRMVGLPYLAFARDLPDGMATLLACAFAATWFAIRGTSGRVRYIARTCLVPLIVVVVLMLAWTTAHASQWRLQQPLRTSGPAAASLAAAVWLAARVAAKLEADRRESHAAFHCVFMALLGAAAVLVLCTPWTPRMPHAFLLGLAAAYAIGDEQVAPSGIKWQPAMLVPLALVVWNMWRVDPANRQDPRNYDTAMQRDLETGALEPLRRRITFFEALSPAERKTHLWRARVAVREDRPHEAAAEFAASLASRDKRRAILPTPTEGEQEDFLMRLRDYCSSLPRPERPFAYEKALVSAGRTEGALAVLKFRAGFPEATALPLAPIADEASRTFPPEGARPLAVAVAAILGQEDLAERLAKWPSSNVLTLLKNWGASVESAPAAFPRNVLPLILISQIGAGEGNVTAIAGRRSAAKTLAVNPAADRRCVHETAWIGWTLLAKNETSSWTFALTITKAHEDQQEVARVVISSEGDLELQTHRADAGPLPDEPAILVWLP